MPDLPDRSKFEKQLALVIGDKLNGALKKLMSYLDPENPSMDDIPAAFWAELGTDLSKAIQPKLAQVFETAGQGMETALGTTVTASVDWSLINKAAAEWAKKYTFDLIKGINETTQGDVSDVITAFFEQGLNMGEARGLLEDTFGPVRAALIASTEVTRASVQGELSIVNNIETDSDIKMNPTWQTSEDDHVCDECGPRDGKGPDEWDTDEYPPLHPSCRCWINYVPEGWE